MSEKYGEEDQEQPEDDRARQPDRGPSRLPAAPGVWQESRRAGVTIEMVPVMPTVMPAMMPTVVAADMTARAAVMRDHHLR